MFICESLCGCEKARIPIQQHSLGLWFALNVISHHNKDYTWQPKKALNNTQEHQYKKKRQELAHSHID